MRKFALGLGCAALLGTASASWATVGVVFSEDFESYADTAAMTAVWADDSYLGTGIAPGVLTDTLDYDGDGTPDETNKTAFHPGGVVNTYDLGTTLLPTVDEWIKLTVDIFDDDTALPPEYLVPDNKRMSLGLRAGAGANLIELGMYNNPIHFAYRASLFQSFNGTPNPSWQAWDMGTELVGATEYPVNRFQGAKWHQYIVTIKPESIVFDFDMDRDGTIDASVEHFDIAPTAAGFDQLRFGGPSNNSSSGGGVHFDNIVLEIISAAVLLDGDLNSDGFVGLADLDIVLGHWNQNVTAGDLLLGDPSGDGFVGLEDLDTVLGNWNAGTPPPALVPEPATFALLGLGGLAMLRRR